MMKAFVLCSLVVSIALGEPPVGNRYLPPQQNLGPPSQTYGAPNVAGLRQTDAVFRTRPSSNYGAPSISPSPRRPTNQYLPPGNPGFTQSPSNQYSAPAKIANQYLPPNQGLNIPNQGLLAPRGLLQPSAEYGAPQGSQFGNERLSNQYLPPNGQNGQRPSAEYGAPVPSSQYGAPGFDGNQQFGGGYDSARNGGYGAGEDGSGEPANYSFEYMVKDEQSGNDFGHRESRQGERAVGVYYALLPDGRKQTVEYEADQRGYRPRISYEDTGLGANGGYNRNAQGYNQQNFDSQGPY